MDKWHWFGSVAGLLVTAYLIVSSSQVFTAIVCFLGAPLGFVLIFISAFQSKKDDDTRAQALIMWGFSLLILAAACYGLFSLDEAYSWGIAPPDGVKG